MENKPVTFEIGLVMAGAVSAGAYTAGVVDYIIEVLDTWHQARKPGTDVPIHDLKIRVLTGASAGGMTAAISIAELLNRPIMPDGMVPPDYKSLLYRTWVEDIDITQLLDTTDLTQHDDIKSLLDSTAIEKIAENVIDEKSLTEKVMQRWSTIPFVDPELRVYLTLSNLRGLPYEFKLSGETGFPYGMTDHSDYQYIKISKETKEEDWIKLRNAAIATGAFPIGLAPRLIQRDLEEYKIRLHKDGRAISGLLKIDTAVNKPYNFVAVDGGTLNNEPIELARSLWINVGQESKDKILSTDQAAEIERQKMQAIEDQNCPYALILVDPFPDLSNEGEDATENDTALQRIIAPIIGALRAQSLFKIEELIEAGDEENDDRFLISPIRYTEQNTLAKNAIASGFFSGFGGFLSKAFRKHDYHLGRRNCQQFLRKYFAVEKAKAIEYGWKPSVQYEFERKVTQDGTTVEKTYYPIIPIIKGTPVDKAQGDSNEWPTYEREQGKTLKKNLSTRIGALLNKTLPFGWIGNRWVGILILLLAILVISGEFIKAATSNWPLIFSGLKNTYILIFQIILLLVLVALAVLRICKFLIQQKLTTVAHKAFLSQAVKWGIKTK